MAGKRGAPRGNRNALKHGFYSRAYTISERQKLSRANFDIAQNNFGLFKVIISRTMDRIKPSTSKPLTFQENLTALQTVVLAIHQLHASINFTRLLDGKNYMDMESTYNYLMSLHLDDEDSCDDATATQPPDFPEEPVKKRGAQPGNLNALKHGTFARHYSPEEIRRLKNLDPEDLSEEITLLQVLMLRVFSGLTSYLLLPDYFKAVRTLVRAGACLDRIRRVQFSMDSAVSPMQLAYQELASLPFDVD
jgi:hypothetical protein